MYFTVKSLVVCHKSLVYTTVYRILFRFWRRRMEAFNCRSTLLLPTSDGLNAYRPRNILLLLNNCRSSKIFFAIQIPSFRSRGEFDAFTASCFLYDTLWFNKSDLLNENSHFLCYCAGRSCRSHKYWSGTVSIMKICRAIFDPQNNAVLTQQHSAQ